MGRTKRFEMDPMQAHAEANIQQRGGGGTIDASLLLARKRDIALCSLGMPIPSKEV